MNKLLTTTAMILLSQTLSACVTTSQQSLDYARKWCSEITTVEKAKEWSACLDRFHAAIIKNPNTNPEQVFTQSQENCKRDFPAGKKSQISKCLSGELPRVAELKQLEFERQQAALSAVQGHLSAWQADIDRRELERAQINALYRNQGIRTTCTQTGVFVNCASR